MPNPEQRNHVSAAAVEDPVEVEVVRPRRAPRNQAPNSRQNNCQNKPSSSSSRTKVPPVLPVVDGEEELELKYGQCEDVRRQVLQACNLPLDYIIFAIIIWNFGVVGMISIHWQGPLRLQRLLLYILSNPPSLSNLSPSSRDHTRALTEPGTRFGSPVYRSVIRKPVIRAPILSDPDIYPHQHRRMGSVREIKVGSLDRHFMLSPRDLFNESKLMRVNSSITSLSTPSFRTRPEVETRGPCFMGLCLPKEFSMIFHSSETCLGCIKLRERKPAMVFGEETLKSMQNSRVGDGGSLGGNRNSIVYVGSVVSSSSVDSTDRRRIVPESPHGKNLLRKEIIRMVSNMISCVGAKANEQGILRLK